MSKTAQDTTTVAREVLARYEAVIGLEVHAQLETVTKAFCGCSTKFGAAPNSNTCPVCLGLPGALPVLNKRALELALRASLAINCTIQQRSRFARKNYFYPDLPKGYQISMYELPLALAGWLEIEVEGEKKRIGITRLHMEDDAGKSLHEGFPDSDRWSYIDFNRCGVPLIEIVSEPDLRTPAEAYAYLTTLKQILEYTEVSDCNMEEGSLRCDANVSVRLRGAPKFGTKAEVKNLNSFRYLAHALEYEIERQIGVIESGGTISQETRLWNVAAGRTEPMRSKEFAHDYRYFPDPDLLPVTRVGGDDRGRAPGDAGIAGREDRALPARLRHHAVRRGRADGDARAGRLFRGGGEGRRARESRRELDFGRAAAPPERCRQGHCRFARSRPRRWPSCSRKSKRAKSPPRAAKKCSRRCSRPGRARRKSSRPKDSRRSRDTSAIEKIARAIVAKNPDNVAKYRAGNEGVFKFFVGQVMRETRGQANPQIVNEIVKRVLSE